MLITPATLRTLWHDAPRRGRGTCAVIASQASTTRSVVPQCERAGVVLLAVLVVIVLLTLAAYQYSEQSSKASIELGKIAHLVIFPGTR